jgi:CheY-like chemotaxis protein
MNLQVLIIDDNRRYTAILRERLEKQGFVVCHELSSQAGFAHLKELHPEHYDIIITDITMETQVSGIYLTWLIRRLGFKGCLIIYSTGFNTPVGLWASKLFFQAFRVNGLIPKNGLKAGFPKMTVVKPHRLLETVEKALV